MRTAAKTLEILGMMAAHESAVADLYKAYSERFSQYREFFAELVTEEQQHARNITRFVTDARKGIVSIQPGRFDQQSIMASLDSVQHHLAEVVKKDFTVTEALQVSAALEDTLIEQGFLAITAEDSPALQELLRSLAEETEQHRLKVHAALESLQD